MSLVTSKTGLPPGPDGSVIGGSLREFSANPLGFLRGLARDYGPLASFRLGSRRIFLASGHDLIDQVLVHDAKHYIKHFGARAYKPVLGNGLVTSEGTFWLQQRRLVQPAFLKTRVQSYAPTMAELTEQMLAHRSSGQTIQIDTTFSDLTSRIALKTLFDLEDEGDREQFTAALEVAFDLMSQRLRRLLKAPLWFPTPQNLRLRKALREVDRKVESFIEAGRTRRQGRDDLLSRLLNAKYPDGSGMSDEQIRDEAMTLYLAGHETTALALTWSWYLLAKHPQVEEKLLAEWRRVLGGASPTADDLGSLPYTAAVITETMRLLPPVYLTGREATVDLELAGYRVKPGYTVFISQWVNHRDPEFFPEPDKFVPERWEDGLAQRLPKYAYFPFGGGQRLCVGNTFALMEAAIILAIVGQRYRFTIDSDWKFGIKPQITLLPATHPTTTLQSR